MAQDREPMQKVRVEIKVEDGDDWNAPTIASVTREQTLGGHALGVAPVDELAKFIEETVDDAKLRAIREVSAASQLAAVRLANE